MKSGILVRTGTSKKRDALALLAKRYDHEFVAREFLDHHIDPAHAKTIMLMTLDEVYTPAILELFKFTGNKYLPVFIEIMKDNSYGWGTRVSALSAVCVTRNNYVRNVLRELADDEEALAHFAAQLADAFYRQGDIEYIEKISSRADSIKKEDLEHVEWLLDKLSRKIDIKWCYYLDEHGVCMKHSYPSECYAYSSVRFHVIDEPADYDYRTCPAYIGTSSPYPF